MLELALRRSSPSFPELAVATLVAALSRSARATVTV
jgi:hypothetical protein